MISVTSTAETYGPQMVFGDGRWGAAYASEVEGGDVALEVVDTFAGSPVNSIAVSVDGADPVHYNDGEVLELDADGESHNLTIRLTNQSGVASSSTLTILTEYISNGLPIWLLYEAVQD